jgi:molybdate transport system substrate-binding protein
MRRCRRAVITAFVVVLGGLPRSWAEQPGKERAPDPEQARTVNVFAAASLTGALQTVGSTFEKAHPDVKAVLNFAGSPTLVQQIQQGAPADVFASADEANMQKLVDSGEVAGAPQLFARNHLEIVVPAGNPKHLVTLADLAKPGLTIALCGPTVPCGRYAADAFGKAGVAVPAASQELDVNAVLSKVAMGEADAGIVYVTDVRAAGGKVEGVAIPQSSNVTVRYPIAVVKHAPHPAAAATFVEFVLSPEGQRLLAGFGFLPR